MDSQTEPKSLESTAYAVTQVGTTASGNLEQKGGQQVSKKRHRLKGAALELVHLGRPHRQSSNNDKPSLNLLRHEPAFNPNAIEKEMTRRYGKTAKIADRSRATAEEAIQFAIHPKKTVRKKVRESATSRFTPARQPYASKAEEMKQLDQHEISQSNDASSEHRAESKIRAAVLEERRDSIRTAWTTSRLRRIRVVRLQPRPFPTRDSCKYWNETYQMSKVDWMQWLGHFMLYLTQSFTPLYIDGWNEPPFDRVSTRTHLERFVLATSHWQAWAMGVRSVYRWEEPKRTARWLVLYITLWYINRIMAFFWMYIIYHVVSNRFQERTLENVRKAAQRAMDRESSAFELGELIDRHGSDEWFDKLVEALGPNAQLQLNDMANLFEVMQNFHAWKAPTKTIWTLSLFASCLACSLFVDTEYCMRVMWLGAGTIFFCCWPVSSCYPKYRLLVSPLKWLFWGIPTHADLSFEFLKKHAEIERQGTTEEHQEGRSRKRDKQMHAQYTGDMSNPEVSPTSDKENIDTAESPSDGDWQSATSSNSDDNDSEGDLMSFRASYKGSGGRIYISSEGLRFNLKHPCEQCWKIPWTDLDEMWKADLRGHHKVTKHGLFDSGALQLKNRNGQLYTLGPMKHRDEAFNCIIGFSRLQWQELATEPGKGREPMEGESVRKQTVHQRQLT